METTTLKRERRFFEGLELRSMPESSLPTIVGYAAVFNSPSKLLYGRFYEIIEPTYFDNVLKSPNLLIRAYRNHDKNRVCGTYCPSKNIRSLQVEVDSKGLKITLNPTDNSVGRDLVADIRAGNIDSMSIGHWVATETESGLIDGYPVRKLGECLKIDDISFVDTAAYAETIAELRGLPDDMNLSDYESLFLGKSPSATPWLNIRKREHLLLNFD